jgi:hypothetical protein
MALPFVIHWCIHTQTGKITSIWKFSFFEHLSSPHWSMSEPKCHPQVQILHRCIVSSSLWAEPTNLREPKYSESWWYLDVFTSRKELLEWTKIRGNQLFSTFFPTPITLNCQQRCLLQHIICDIDVWHVKTWGNLNKVCLINDKVNLNFSSFLTSCSRSNPLVLLRGWILYKMFKESREKQNLCLLTLQSKAWT